MGVGRVHQGQKSFLTYVPSLVLKTRHLGGSAFCRLGVPEQALGGIPLGFVEAKPSELSCVLYTQHGLFSFFFVA